MKGGRTKTADGRPPALAYFLTNGRSLEDWARVGSLSRELSLLRRFADEGWRVSLYSYDKTRESEAFVAEVRAAVMQTAAVEVTAVGLGTAAVRAWKATGGVMRLRGLWFGKKRLMAAAHARA